MIYFYNKFILFLLPLSILPLVLHLLYLKYSKNVKFTYVYLIDKVLKQYLPKKKIIDIIILILRCIIIFLILLYLARPVIYVNPVSKKSVKIVLLIDNSYSMQQKVGERTKFDICKNWVIELLKEISNYNVRVKTVVFNDIVKPLHNDFVVVNQKLFDDIISIQPSFNGTNIISALNYVLSLCSDIKSDTRIKVIAITDFSEHILKNDILLSSSNYTGCIDIAFCYPPLDEKNLYFHSVEIIPKDDLAEILYNVKIVNSENLTTSVKLSIEGETVDMKNVFTGDNNKFVYFYEKNIPQRIAGELILPVDSLPEDNVFYFVFDTKPEKPEVLTLINEPLYLRGYDSKKFYIENLKVLDNKINIKCVEGEALQQDWSFIDKYKVVISIGLTTLDQLQGLIDENKILIVSPDDKINIENYELTFPGIEFIELQEQRLNKYKLDLGSNEDFNKYVQKFDYMNVVVTKKFLVTITQPDTWKVLLKYNDNTPALINKDNIYIFSFCLDKNWTNFVYKPIFVGIFDYIINKTTTELILKDYYYISETIDLSNVTGLKIYHSSMQDYDKNKLYEKDDKGIKIFFPGIYEISFYDKENTKIAVNISPEESDVKPIDKNKIKKLFRPIKNIQIAFFEIKESKVKPILQWCFGKELTDNLFFIFILLFVIETIVSRLFKKII